MYPVKVPYTGVVAVSPAVFVDEEKNQDRARFFGPDQVACVCDGVTTSPRAAEAAFAEMLGHLKTSLAGERFRNSFPPMLFHLSDGESATDATALAQEAMQQSTADGGALVVNAYVGTRTRLSYNGPEDFPGYIEVSEVGSREDNIRLFDMSSEVPPCIEANLKADGIFPQLRPGSRLFFDVRTKDMLKHVIQVIGSMNSRMER